MANLYLPEKHVLETNYIQTKFKVSILVACIFSNQTNLLLNNVRNTSLALRAWTISPAKIEKLISEVSKVLNYNTRIKCYVRVYLFTAFHLDHEIDHCCFIVNIYTRHSLRHENMHYYKAMHDFQKSLQKLCEILERSLCKTMK